MAGRIEAMVLKVAAGSAGVCTRAELRAAGVVDRTISARLEAGTLVRTGDGVFEVPALVTADTPLYRAAKAHPSGALSHRTAARLWGLPITPASTQDPLEVTVPRPASTRPAVPGVIVHRARRWSNTDVARPMPGLSATAPARTMLDLAGVGLGEQRLRHMAQTALTAGLLTVEDLASCLDRVGGRGVAGSGRLRRLVAAFDDGEPVPQSALEWRLAELLDDRFGRQYRPPWYDGIRGVVDVAEPISRVIVEGDGRRWHATEQAMVEDRRRDRLASLHGWLVLRVTWSDIVVRPETTTAEIDAIVARRTRTAA